MRKIIINHEENRWKAEESQTDKRIGWMRKRCGENFFVCGEICGKCYKPLKIIKNRDLHAKYGVFCNPYLVLTYPCIHNIM